MGWTMFANSIFDRLKPKIGCSNSISKRWTRSSTFNVRKNDVRVCLMNNLIKVKAFWFRCSFVRGQNSGVRVRSSIDELVQVRPMFENDVRVRSMSYKMVFHPSLKRTPNCQKRLSWALEHNPDKSEYKSAHCRCWMNRKAFANQKERFVSFGIFVWQNGSIIVSFPPLMETNEGWK